MEDKRNSDLEVFMKIICTIVGVVLLFVGLAPRASGTCTNPNSILQATYGWQSQALLAAGKSPNPKIGDFIPSVQVGHLIFDGNGNFSGAHDTAAGGMGDEAVTRRLRNGG